MIVLTAVLALMAATAVVSTVVTATGAAATSDDAKKKSTGSSSSGSSKKTCGMPKGKKVLNVKKNSDWYRICKLWVDNERNGRFQGRLTQTKFLQDDITGPNFGNTAGRSEENSFSQYLKKYRKGELKNNEMMRDKQVLYPLTEKAMIDYIDLRAEKYKTDNIGLHWETMRAKCMEEAKNNGEYKLHGGFEASDGWMSKALRRAGRVGIKLHGEANEMDDAEREEIMRKWREEDFHPVIEKHDIPPDRIYNADQTGLYYQKLPNRLYVEHSRKKEYAGVKQMKDKNRVTLMVLTAADGTKGPLSMVGKSKKPHCFRRRNGKPPMHYTNQKNAWFDKKITEWWIMNVFWPWHLQKHGNVCCILILDNCTAHKIDCTNISDKIIIIFLPPNVTNKHQPADMGMIAAMKVGYRVIMLGKLLAIFDVEGGYEAAAAERATRPKGCRGLEFGGKAHLLDAMDILLEIWNKDDKYARNESIVRCWRKANIMPHLWNIDSEVDVGSASVPMKDKQISKEECDEICDLFDRIQLKVESDTGNLSQFSALAGSFALDGTMSNEDRQLMAEEWANVEDDPFVKDAEIDEELQRLDGDCDMKGDKEDDDDGEAEDDHDGEADPNDPMDIDVTLVKETKSKLTLNEMENMLRILREHVTSEGAPSENMNFLLQFGNNMRAFNASKVRSQPTINTFFKLKETK